jgi:hypothetical protein
VLRSRIRTNCSRPSIGLDLDQPSSQCLADAKVPTQQIKQVPPGRADGEVRPLGLALLGAVRRRLWADRARRRVSPPLSLPHLRWTGCSPRWFRRSFASSLHVHDVAAIAGEIGLLFIVAWPRRWPPRHGGCPGQWLAPAFLVGGVGVFETGLWTRSLPMFIAGTLLAGTGFGLAFRRGVALTQRLADPERRADLLSTSGGR